MNCSDVSSADLDMRDHMGIEPSKANPVEWEKDREFLSGESWLAQADGDPGDESK